MLLRLEVRRIDLVRREPGFGVPLEEVELVGERILDLARELPPVIGRERARAVEDLAEGRRRHVPAEVHAREAQPT